jgi:hypothetical protein
MKRITWIILGLLALLPTAQAENLDSTWTHVSVQRFVRGNSIVEITIPSDVNKSTVKIYRNFNKSNIEHTIQGVDLGDGGNDDLVITTDPVNTSLREVSKIIIFRRTPDGSYDYLAHSSDIEYGKASIEFRNKSLYILVSNNTLKESNEEIYQFKYRNDGISW